jgi:FtsP/CotA-like multicopper oxidase with cupredoxin domain
VSVTADGVHRFLPRLILHALPSPESVAPAARVFVAWLTTPLFSEWISLGAVANGENRLPEIALDKFMLVISAEPSAAVISRTGPLVLRGGSPSTRMQPPDFQELSAGIMGLSPDQVAGLERDEHEHGTHDGWPAVPMPAGFGMLPAEMLLRPGLKPLLPAARSGIPMARATAVVVLQDGDSLTLTAGLVRKRIHGREHVMYAFNDQIPGPLLQVSRGTTVHAVFVNHLDQPSTIHWHGLRLDHRMDGVPHLSQHPVVPGDTFNYTITFPDAGLYWYHPHVREDMQQDLGLSGNIMVAGMPDLPAVSRELVLLLDDILIGDTGLIPFGDEHATHALMGRFGNVILVNGEPNWSGGTVRVGETVRLWFTNAANTRTFNLSVTNATMQLVAADLGGFDVVLPVTSVVVAPAERYAVDVTFTGAGPAYLVNQVQALDHLQGEFIPQQDTLGMLSVDDGDASSPARLTERVEVVGRLAEHHTVMSAVDTIPDMVLEFGLRTSGLPFITQRMMVLDSAYFHPVEWSGTMAMMNWATTGAQAHWFVRDSRSGLENEAARFTVRRGERRLIRLVNLRNTLHAMQHPIHLHGQRFLVINSNGSPVAARAWKDTVLLPAGGTVDILVEFTNPGQWMLHCHIAEHVESGMMTTFVVEE